MVLIKLVLDVPRPCQQEKCSSVWRVVLVRHLVRVQVDAPNAVSGVSAYRRLYALINCQLVLQLFFTLVVVHAVEPQCVIQELVLLDTHLCELQLVVTRRLALILRVNSENQGPQQTPILPVQALAMIAKQGLEHTKSAKVLKLSVSPVKLEYLGG